MEKYLEYPNIDFGKRYTVTTNGEIISNYTHKPMSFAYKNGDIYKRVVLTDNSHKKHLLYVHRIVAYNFIPNPYCYSMINHIDENPANNIVTNLEWCDIIYNNTYNNRHKKVGEKLKGKTPWNKGQKMSPEFCEKCRQSAIKRVKRKRFNGNQYVNADGTRKK